MAVMTPRPGSDADYIRDKARRDLLNLLEGVSKAADPGPAIDYSAICTNNSPGPG